MSKVIKKYIAFFLCLTLQIFFEKVIRKVIIVIKIICRNDPIPDATLLSVCGEKNASTKLADSMKNAMIIDLNLILVYILY